MVTPMWFACFWVTHESIFLLMTIILSSCWHHGMVMARWLLFSEVIGRPGYDEVVGGPRVKLRV